jgi:hypothetical protein
MTPGWTNIRNRLAESHQQSRGLAGVNLRVALILFALSLAAWGVVIEAIRLVVG